MSKPINSMDGIVLMEEGSSSTTNTGGQHNKWLWIGILCCLLVVLIIVLPTSIILTLPHDNDDFISSTTITTDDQFPAYQIWCLGNCAIDVQCLTQPGAVMMGGGEFAEDAFRWQITNANGGDFVVIGASGSNAYNEYIYNLSISMKKPLNSMRTISFNSKSASYDQTLLSYISNAEAIFIAGGDQYTYIQQWVDTPVQTTLQSKISTVTIGGTSAGCMVLGNWVYTGGDTALSLTSQEAMMNPYNPDIDIVPRFLDIPFLETVLLDTHFGKFASSAFLSLYSLPFIFFSSCCSVTRNRMGRTLTFTARVLGSTPKPPVERGIGVDEETALLLNYSTGMATTVGIGTAYICNSSQVAEICKPYYPLTYLNVTCIRLNATSRDEYSLKTWSGHGVEYVNRINNATFTTPPYGPNGYNPYLVMV